MNVYNTFTQNSKTEQNKTKKTPGHKSFVFQWVDD